MTLAQLHKQMFDNLFSANHRNKMIQKHKGTMAQIVKVEFNKTTQKAEIVNDLYIQR